MSVPIAGISKTVQKDLERNGQRTENAIQLPGILLAQWSKNFSAEEASPISGKTLMREIEKIFLQIQSLVGGNFIFLECEATRTGLLYAYENTYGYTTVSERLSHEAGLLFQLMKKI